MERVLDASKNRAAEGVRVLEDFTRFELEDMMLTAKLRKLRHAIRKTGKEAENWRAREATTDVGVRISNEQKLDTKTSTWMLIEANSKRVEEALRSIEETLRIMGYYAYAKAYEKYRFEMYTIEQKLYEALERGKKKDFTLQGLYALTGEPFANGRTSVEIVKDLLEGGVKIIQYREKEKDKISKYNDCKEIRKLTREYGCFFIVNDDIDIALAVNADGLHIGQEDLPLPVARRLAPHLVIGVSTHNKEQAQKAVEEGADYIGVGPLFETNTRVHVEKCEGLSYLEWVHKNITIPYVVIGGIKERHLEDIAKKGAASFAMVTNIIGQENIIEVVQKTNQRWREVDELYNTNGCS